jgi:hypothetical protein
VCKQGYSGVACEVSKGCAGPYDRHGKCCAGVGAVALDATNECCAGALDRNGTCCPAVVNGTAQALNGCGVCGGPATAVFAADGTCCEGGVLAADGLCCPGALDAFGVCDGNEESGAVEVGDHGCVARGLVLLLCL